VGSLAPSSPAANAAEAQFQACVRNAMADLPRHELGFGRFGGRPSSAVRTAIGVCQTLAAGSSGSSGSSGSPGPSGSTGSPGSGPAANGASGGAAPKM
jgi:hypothetical protein